MGIESRFGRVHTLSASELERQTANLSTGNRFARRAARSMLRRHKRASHWPLRSYAQWGRGQTGVS
jgi:hypothetical protein